MLFQCAFERAPKMRSDNATNDEVGHMTIRSLTDSATTTETLDSPINYDELVDRCLGKIDFAERVLSKFHDRFPDSLNEMLESTQEGDLESVARVAHRLKGAAANISARGILEAAQEIETIGRHGQAEELPPWLDRLNSEWERFTEYTQTRRLEPADS